MSKPRQIPNRPLSKPEEVLPFINDVLIPFLVQQQRQYVPLTKVQIFSDEAATPPDPPPAGTTAVSIYISTGGGFGSTLWIYIPASGWNNII